MERYNEFKPTINDRFATGLSVAAILFAATPHEQAEAATRHVPQERTCEIKPIKNGTQQSCDYLEDGVPVRNVTFNRRVTSTVIEMPEATVTRDRYQTERKDYLYKESGRRILQKVSMRPPRLVSSYLQKDN